jgi:hypothetical protein
VAIDVCAWDNGHNGLLRQFVRGPGLLAQTRGYFFTIAAMFLVALVWVAFLVRPGRLLRRCSDGKLLPRL